MKADMEQNGIDTIANYEEQSTALFKEWELRIKREISIGVDGLVDPEAYFSSRPKIMFVLKEIHGSPWERDNLRTYLNKEAVRGFTWNNAVRWKRLLTQAFVDGPDALPDYAGLGSIGLRMRKKELASLAVINLKKVPGASTAHDATIGAYAKQHGDLLARQVGLIDPDIIIAGGVLLKHIHGFEGLEEDKEPFWCVEELLGRRRLVIWSYHPQAYGKDGVSYSFMAKVASEVAGKYGRFWE